MPKKWKRVPYDASAEDTGRTIIRITRAGKGDVMAAVESLQWHEPDGHEYTGYTSASESGRRPDAEVIADFKKISADVALESDELWNQAWGNLV